MVPSSHSEQVKQKKKRKRNSIQLCRKITYTHSSGCKTGNNKEVQWTKSEFKSVNVSWHTENVLYEIKILTSISQVEFL